MLLLISSFIVMLYSVILIVAGKNLCIQTSEKASKCIPMSYGMIMSTVVGLIITFIHPGDLVVTTVISIIVSFVLALALGLLFGLSGVIEALGASLMGAMMGAMLAAMTPDHRISFILIAMDIFFVLFVALLLYYMKEHSDKKVVFNSKKIAIGASILLVATCLSIVASTALDLQPSPSNVEEVDHSHH